MKFNQDTIQLFMEPTLHLRGGGGNGDDEDKNDAARNTPGTTSPKKKKSKQGASAEPDSNTDSAEAADIDENEMDVSSCDQWEDNTLPSDDDITSLLQITRDTITWKPRGFCHEQSIIENVKEIMETIEQGQYASFDDHIAGMIYVASEEMIQSQVLNDD